MSQNVLILERSGKNLKKVGDKGKTVLEGVFAEFGVENRNGRIYEEKEYLPHLEYLKSDINTGNLLGELDHPERFEVALGNVSHRISELWYDQSARQIKGRIEILEGTPKGQIAKALLEAGVPLSISSRAAGTVNEDKTVSIQQIYTYDLVAKPGFEAAQLKTINESAKSRVSNLVTQLNESYNQFESKYNNISSSLGIVNENLSIYDVSDKFPATKLRPEAKSIIEHTTQTQNNNIIMENQNATPNDVQQLATFLKSEIAKLNEKYTALENSFLNGGSSKEVEKLKAYVEKLRGIQEGQLQWSEDIAKAVNKLGKYSDKLAKKNNEHYSLTEKIMETVDHNAKALNFHQDWTTQIAETLNAAVDTIDHNAEMTDGLNEWVTEIAQGVNVLNEWGQEKAQAINSMHEWTSSIAKNVNESFNWSEENFGRSLSKKDAMRLVEYIEVIGEGKKDPELKKKLDEVLASNKIKGQLNEDKYFPEAITDVKKTGNVKVDVDAGKDSAVEFDGKIIKAKTKGASVGGKLPKGLKVLDDNKAVASKASDGKNVKGIKVLDATKVINVAKDNAGGGPSAKNVAAQQLANVDGKQKVNESFDLSSVIKERNNKLEGQLSKIVESLENEKATVNKASEEFPFVTLLGESDRSRFAKLSQSDKKKVAQAIDENPTNESGNILRLWESALAGEVEKAPLYVTAAPEKYRKLWESASEETKRVIQAKSEYFTLETPYQIENFWETSGIANDKRNLNEVFSAAMTNNDVSEEKYDDFVSAVAEKMRSYNA